MGPVPTIEKQPTTQTQSLIFVLCGMAVAFVGLARLTSGSGADTFLGAAMLMVGNWMVLPQLIALAVSRNR